MAPVASDPPRRVSLVASLNFPVREILHVINEKDNNLYPSDDQMMMMMMTMMVV